MRISDDLRKSVVFFGYEDALKPSGITGVGTGFMLAHDEVGYLVTVKHLSQMLGADPFLLRLNRKDGTADMSIARKASQGAKVRLLERGIRPTVQPPAGS